MNPSAEPEILAATAQVPADNTFNLLVNGELGKQLGLTGDQLRIGLRLAKNHLTRGAPAEAMRIYVALVLCEPMNIDFQVGLSNCASALGEHHVALHAASAVIAMAPRDPRGYLLSGRSCLMLGSFEEAKVDLSDALHFAAQAGDAIVAQEATQLLDRLNVAMAS